MPWDWERQEELYCLEEGIASAKFQQEVWQEALANLDKNSVMISVSTNSLSYLLVSPYRVMLDQIRKAGSMIQKAQQLRQQQDRLQKMLSTIRVVGQSKNQKVMVTITGEQKIVDVKIDPELISFVYENFISKGKEDSMMSKSIIEAVDDGISKVQEEVIKKMQETGSISDFMAMLQAASDK